MKANRVNRWLTLAANFGVLIGIFLLLVELDQNSHVVRAQISSERATQAIDIFMTIADSAELSSVDAALRESGFPDDTSAIAELSPAERRQYYWYLSAQRTRLENILYQQTLGIVYDPDALPAAKELLPILIAFGANDGGRRLEQLISQADEMQD